MAVGTTLPSRSLGKYRTIALYRILFGTLVPAFLSVGALAHAGTRLDGLVPSFQSRHHALSVGLRGRLPNPYGALPNPFTVKPNPYGALPNPFTIKPNPYGALPNPFTVRPAAIERLGIGGDARTPAIGTASPT